jgi:hypothetical protein
VKFSPLHTHMRPDGQSVIAFASALESGLAVDSACAGETTPARASIAMMKAPAIPALIVSLRATFKNFMPMSPLRGSSLGFRTKGCLPWPVLSLRVSAHFFSLRALWCETGAATGHGR